MTKKSSLVSALQGVSNNASEKKEGNKVQVKSIKMKNTPINTPPSREGKKAITGFFDPIVSKQLKQLALDEDTTSQALIAEALNDLFIKYNHKPIA